MGNNYSLFSGDGQSQQSKSYSPLAERMRPSSLSEFEGLSELDSGFIRLLENGEGIPPSVIFWGPPGSGKTTLARLTGEIFQLPFVEFSAVLGGVQEVRKIVAKASQSADPTLLFVDEIHRFNKAQQDAFLPHIEKGTIILFGSTTENPSFVLNGALLSRARVIQIPARDAESLNRILDRAIVSYQKTLDESARKALIQYAAGDARRMLNLVEAVCSDVSSATELSVSDISRCIQDRDLVYDRDGEEHYNMASAFIKSMRGSNADAALYWGFRMIESGEDPRFIIRRMIIFASEDIGNADAQALSIATATAEAFERVGLPEGRIPIAQCITYLATAPKSNRSYIAMKKVLEVIREYPQAEVPMHLRNAPTQLMKDIGYGEGYQYAHDYSAEELEDVQYLPDEIADMSFYQPPASTKKHKK